MQNLNSVYERNKYYNNSQEQAKRLGNKFVGINKNNVRNDNIDMSFKSGPIKKYTPEIEEFVSEEVVTDEFKVKIVGLIARRENVVNQKVVKVKKELQKRSFKSMF